MTQSKSALPHGNKQSLALPPGKKQYLAAAKELFEANGFEKTSLKSIARHCGGNEQAIKDFFGSKQALMEQSYAYCPDNPSPLHLAVLDVARSHFELLGFGGANMDMIAKLAGISRTRAFQLFGGKKKLWDLLPEVHRRQVANSLDTLQFSSLMQTAKRLFEKAGYTRTTLEMIAEEAGIPKSTLVYHFKSKQALFEECGAEKFDTKDVILNATVQAVAANSFSGTTLAHVAELAGVTSASINQFFGTKENLFLLAGVPLAEKISQALYMARILDGLNARERLLIFLQDIVRIGKKEPEILVYIATWRNNFRPLQQRLQGNKSSSEMDDLFLGIFDSLVELTREGVNEGSIRACDPHNLTLLHIDLAFSPAINHILKQIADESIWDETYKLFCRSLEP